MGDIISGSVLIIVGVIVIYFRKRFARNIVAIQNKTFSFHFGGKEIRANEWLLPLFGFLAIVVGILTLVDLF